MHVVGLKAENYQILKAIEIHPGVAGVITIGGKNSQGKSSILDAVWVALKGRAAAPAQPVRKGEEKCTIQLDMGEVIVTRTFTDKGDGKPYTDTVKVENAAGMRYGKPKEVLDALLSSIGFDPFEFTQLKPGEKAEKLLELVPLPVDLDEHKELDDSDYARRRDVNRDIEGLQGQLRGYPKEDIPKDIPDRDALVEKLGNAANHNLAIDRSRMERDRIQTQITEEREYFIPGCQQRAKALRDQLERETKRLTAEIAAEEAKAAEAAKSADENQATFDALPPLAEPIDTDTVREEIRLAENAAAIKARQEARASIEAQITAKTAESEAFTKALKDREAEREAALAKAKMPIEGLGFQLDEKGKPLVTFNGVPFEQISRAEQLRASTAIAMASNPTLRVLQIHDGSLLDDDSMAMLAEMAADQDFQVFVEKVGIDDSFGVIIQDGTIIGGTLAGASELKPKVQPEKSKREHTDDLLRDMDEDVQSLMDRDRE